jgi:hypothetical protein
MQNGSAVGGVIGGIIGFAIVVFMIVAMWRVFSKAGQPGWAVFIPIYNTIVLLRVAGKPWWWLFLMLIPLVNIIIVIIVYAGVATNYGKGGGFTVGLILLPYIFIPILGYGSAVWRPAFGQAPYGQPPYGQPPYGQPPYGQPPAPPARY